VFVILFQISELFSSFDDQPMEHQIELVDALEEFLNTWMIKHGLNGYDVFHLVSELCYRKY